MTFDIMTFCILSFSTKILFMWHFGIMIFGIMTFIVTIHCVVMLSVICGECHYDQCHYTECSYAEYHGTITTANLTAFRIGSLDTASLYSECNNYTIKLIVLNDIMLNVKAPQ
jgi:hypothetical protein